MTRRLDVAAESWPLKQAFRIARGAKSEAAVVVAAIREGDHSGRGECVPYARYGESVQSVIGQIETLRREIESGVSRAALQSLLPAGAARNALDCALIDLQAKIQRTGTLNGREFQHRTQSEAPKHLGLEIAAGDMVVAPGTAQRATRSQEKAGQP